MLEAYDVFLSYSWADQAGVRLLESALRERGLSVWRDERNIDSFASITNSIEQGVARSKVLVAYYSHAYPARRACQFELSAAFIAAQHEGDPRRRVLIVNPEADAGHIEPVELRDELFQHAPLDTRDAASVADAIGRHVAELEGLIGEVDVRARPQWFGTKPTGSTRFVGRVRTMWELHSAIHGFEYRPITGQAGAGAAQLRGLAGMGKSLLAEEYALRFGAAYPGGIFWLYALGSDMVRRSSEERDALRNGQVEAFARTMLPGRVPAGLTPEEIEGLLRQEIERRGLPCLWVVDDFPIATTAAELRSWLAPHPLAHSVVTTRSRAYSALAQPVDLGPLPESDGYELLTTARTPSEPTEIDAARAIVADLGGHALAIDVAGAAVATYALSRSFASFRESLADESEDVLDLAAELAGELPNGHERSIAATIAAAIDQLSVAARDVSRVAAQVAAAPIPLPLVADAVAAVDSIAEPRALAYVEQGTNELQTHSLAERAGDSEEAFEVHALVARAIRFRDLDPVRSDELRSATVQSIIKALHSLEDLEAQSALIPWAVHGRRMTESPDSRDEFELLGLIAHLDYERADYEAAESGAWKTFRGFEQLAGVDDPETLDAKGNVAAILHARSESERAVQLQQEVFDATQRLRGDDDPATLTARGNLAAFLNATGRSDEAREHAEAVLDSSINTVGAESTRSIRALSNLGAVLFNQGEYEHGRRLVERAVGLSERILGSRHSLTLHAKTELSGQLFMLGQLQAAKDIQERLLETTQQLRGPSHDETLLVRTNLAATLTQLGEFEAARDHESAAYALAREALGDDHVVTLYIANNLAMSLSTLGESDAALALMRDTVERSTQVLGERYPDTIRATTNLGELLDVAGIPEEARPIKERSYEAAVEVLGSNHPDTLRIRLSLANTLMELARFAEARDHFESASEKLRLTVGAEHPDTLRGLGNLARIMYRERELAAAAALEEFVLEGRRRQLGPDHPETTIAAEHYDTTLREFTRSGEPLAALEIERERWKMWAEGRTATDQQRNHSAAPEVR